MLDIKEYFRNMYQDQQCRNCRKIRETEEHIQEECEIIHGNIGQWVVTTNDIFNENTKALEKVAKQTKKNNEIPKKCWPPKKLG